ncbi:MAG: glycosyltransferase [Candidatus Dadabacteria bacterium]|nr:MAG: glycosyltransferase [Candidatus Dadabacteria bacterium]
MKAAFITDASDFSDANRALIALLAELKKCNVEAFVLLPGSGVIASELKKLKINYTAVPHKRWVRFAYEREGAFPKLRSNLKLLKAAAGTLREEKINIVHTNSAYCPFGAMLSNALKLPHLWHIREEVNYRDDLRWDWGRWLTKAVISQAGAVIASSESAFKNAVGRSQDTLHKVLYNGVSSVDPAAWPENKAFTFLVYGEIAPFRGQAQAIHAASIVRETYPDIRLVVAGSGRKKDVQELKSLTAALGMLDLVEFMEEDKLPADFIKQSHVALAPASYTADGQIIMEAMAAGRPVIAMDTEANGEFIKHGENGLLYSGSSINLAEEMLQTLKQPRRARELGKAGFEFIKEHCDIKSYAAQVLAVYQELLNGRKG